MPKIVTDFDNDVPAELVVTGNRDGFSERGRGLLFIEMIGGAAADLASPDGEYYDETLAWVGRGGTTTPFELTVDDALALFEAARDQAAKVGIAMALEPVVLHPNKALSEAIDFSLTRAAADED